MVLETAIRYPGLKIAKLRYLKAYHGGVVNAPGDNLLAEFASVVEAISVFQSYLSGYYPFLSFPYPENNFLTLFY